MTFGLLVRNMHRWAAHLMVISVFLHMARVFYHGAYKPPREFNWVIGVILLTLTLLLSFTGYLLPWDQLALWAVTVGTNMMGYTPVFGTQVRFVLLGGVEIGTDTLLAMVRAPRADVPVRHRHLHGHPLLAGPQGRRHLGTAVGQGVRTDMTDVPEHLLRRAAERKAALGSRRPAVGGDAAPPKRPRRRGRADAGESAGSPTTRRARSRAHLLARSGARQGGGERRRRRGGGRRSATATDPTGAAAAAVGRPGAGPRCRRARTVTPSACSPSSRRARSRTSRPRPPTRCTSGPTCWWSSSWPPWP